MSSTLHFQPRSDNPDSKGRYAIRLCITKCRRRKYIALKIFADPEFWDKDNETFIIQTKLKDPQQKAANKQRICDNALLERYKVRAREIIEKFELSHKDWTLNQFEDAFVNTSKQNKFKPYLENHIRTLQETGHIGNAACYSETLRMLQHYDPKLGQRLFPDIDLKYVNGFDIYLQKRGNKGNTRKYYLKALRAILNRAIQEGEASNDTYPFGKGKFEIAKLEEVTAKRYLSSDTFEKIKSTQAHNPQAEYARQLFLFSYYCFGMSFIDMAYLTSDNIVSQNGIDYIVYKRHKIQHQKNVVPIHIQLNESIQALLKTLRDESPTVDGFLLPIVTCAGYSGEKLYNHIRGRYRKYSKYLNLLAEEFNIQELRLTSYVSRHTMAMTMQRNKIQRDVISQVLGHADLKTTNVYLDSFDNSIVDEAARVL